MLHEIVHLVIFIVSPKLISHIQKEVDDSQNKSSNNTVILKMAP